MKIFKLINLFISVFFLLSPTNAQNTLNFDGVDDHINLGNVYNFSLNQAFSGEAWVKVGPSNNIGQIISNFDLNGRGWGFQIKRDNYPANQAYNNGVLTFYLSDDWSNGSSIFVNGITNLRDNQWHHVAFSYDGTSTFTGVRIYIDGVLENVPTTNFLLPGAVITNSGPTFIGALEGPNNTTAENFVGTMDELRIWSGVRLLSDFDAFKHAELTCLPTANLLGYYKFNQGNANGNNVGVVNLIDDSGNNNGGILMNFSLNGNSSNWIGRQNVSTQSNLFCDCYQLTYCYSKGLSDDVIYTNSVSTLNFDDTHTGSSGGYSDYRGHIVEFVAGANDVVKVTRSTNGASVGTGVWVDWNQNGTFEASEQVMDLYGAEPVAGILFTVPDNALSGYTRMRVTTEKNTHPNACGTVVDGEVEDYCVLVRKLPAGQSPGTIQSPFSASPYPNPANIGYQITGTTSSPVIHVLLVNTITGQTYTLPVIASQIDPTGAIMTTLALPTNLTMGLYNLVLLAQDGTLYSDNIRIQ